MIPNHHEPSTGDRVVDYAQPIAVRTSGTELAFGIVALCCGLVLLLLGILVAIVVQTRGNTGLMDRLVPGLVMTGLGVIPIRIGARSIRRSRIKQTPER